MTFWLTIPLYMFCSASQALFGVCRIQALAAMAIRSLYFYDLRYRGSQLIALSHKQLLWYDSLRHCVGCESLCTCVVESDPKDIWIMGEEGRWKNAR